MLHQLLRLHFEFGLDEAWIFLFLILPGFTLGRLLKYHIKAKKTLTIIFLVSVFTLEILTFSRKIAWTFFQYEHYILYRLSFLSYIAECILAPLAFGILLSWIPTHGKKSERKSKFARHDKAG